MTNEPPFGFGFGPADREGDPDREPGPQNPFGFGSGVPWIFQSGSGSVPDDPGFDHFTRVMPMGTTTLHLYATAGQNPSGEEEQVCAASPGYEVKTSSWPGGSKTVTACTSRTSPEAASNMPGVSIVVPNLM